MGSVLAFSTILITALTGLSPDLNPNETMRPTPSEITWIGEFCAAYHPHLRYLLNSNFIQTDHSRCSKYFVHLSTDRKYILWPDHRTDWKEMGNDNGEHSSGHCVASHVFRSRIQRNFACIWFAWHQRRSHGSVGADIHRWSVVSHYFVFISLNQGRKPDSNYLFSLQRTLDTWDSVYHGWDRLHNVRDVRIRIGRISVVAWSGFGLLLCPMDCGNRHFICE